MPRNESIWSATTRLPTYRKLQDNIQADVCIVGAGFSGLTTAYLLSQTGKSIVVIDDGELASGMTAVTTAHLTNVLDDRYFEIERMHGEANARLAAQSHAAAINRIEAIARKEDIHCDFLRVNGYLFRAPEQPEELVEKELAAAKRAGLSDAVMIDRAPIERFDTGRCIAFPFQAQFHPLKYLAGVAKAFEREGGRIYTHTHADSIEGGDVARIQAGRHVIVADAVVVATNAPINDLVAIHTKQAPYMSYVIGARVKPGSVKRALYWDMLDSYHYVRLQDVGADEFLIVGGEDHKSGQADDTAERHGRLEAWARERFPSIREIEFAWAGQVMETHDGLAFIGRNPLDEDNVYVVTGDSGMGMTHGTIAGTLLTDLILGRKNPWEKLYDPARKTVRAAATFASETLNMAAQFGDWVKTGDVASENDIPRGHGAILRRGMTMVAAYRDDQGELHERSAVCNHLGCIVHWNAAESTWDCPCHGSRFDRMGKVINGPANRDLAPLSPGKLRTG